MEPHITSEYEIQHTRPELLSPVSETSRRTPLSQAIRELRPDQEDWLRLPDSANLNSVRTMAYDLGRTAQPSPVKYMVRKDKQGTYWVGCSSWPADQDYPAGREDNRPQAQENLPQEIVEATTEEFAHMQ